LKTHIKRKQAGKHKTCEFCGDKLGDTNSVDMKKHMMTHSTKKEFKLKYEDCEYVGKSRVALDVHIRNCHSDKVYCGLCEICFENSEELNTYKSTCEVYRRCQSKETTISKIIAHVEIEHESERYIMIDHWKISRNDKTEVTTSDFILSLIDLL
jgi:hypothetical protein